MKILIVAVVIVIYAIANKPEKKKYLCGHLKANFNIYTTVSVLGCLIHVFRFDCYSVSVRPALVPMLVNSIVPPSST